MTVTGGKRRIADNKTTAYLVNNKSSFLLKEKLFLLAMNE